MILVTTPVLMAIARYCELNASSEYDGGFIPFFKCPIWQKLNPTKFQKINSRIY